MLERSVWNYWRGVSAVHEVKFEGIERNRRSAEEKSRWWNGSVTGWNPDREAFIRRGRGRSLLEVTLFYETVSRAQYVWFKCKVRPCRAPTAHCLVPPAYTHTAWRSSVLHSWINVTPLSSWIISTKSLSLAADELCTWRGSEVFKRDHVVSTAHNHCRQKLWCTGKRTWCK